jgi:AmmeMemoRadiSam system protein A
MFPSSEKTRAVVTADPPGYSPPERQVLLSLAHRAIEAAVEERELELPSPSEHLAECRGAFTTLHMQGKLRGCIGYVFATSPLYRTIAETARAAALDDPRFHPVTRDETASLKVEISVLSPLQPIAPEEIVIGKHGLVVTQGSRRGLLLPQVPVEWDWDAKTFLAQTCLKAGLAPDAWCYSADLQAFTAEVFGEG